MKKKIVLLILVIVALLFSGISNATEWYVDNTASGTNAGTSWTNAWQSFADIGWGSINPGDTLYISGGSTSKTYNETLTIGASGTSGARIYIKPGSASPSPSGHSGQVVITNPSSYGILISSKTYITIDGQYGTSRNIAISHCGLNGIYVTNASYGNVVTNLYFETNGLVGAYEFNRNGVGVKDVVVTAEQYPVLEVSNSYFYRSYDDGISIASESGSPSYEIFGRYLIHDNIIEQTNSDPIQQRVRGVDIYNNTIFNTWSGGVGTGAHPDGMELYRGWCRVWNNVLYNMHDVLGTGMGSTSYLQVAPGVGLTSTYEGQYYLFNNLVYDTDTLQDWIVGLSMTNTNAANLTEVNGVYIFNNTFVGVQGYAMNMYWNSYLEANPSKVSNYVIENNIFSNCGRHRASFFDPEDITAITFGSDGDGAHITFDYNLVFAGAEGTTDVSYGGSVITYSTFKSTYGVQDHAYSSFENLDPRLDANYKNTSVSPGNGVGKSLLSYFTTDLAGNARPTVGGFDLGSYEYDDGGTPPDPEEPPVDPPVTPRKNFSIKLAPVVE